MICQEHSREQLSVKRDKQIGLMYLVWDLPRLAAGQPKYYLTIAPDQEGYCIA